MVLDPLIGASILGTLRHVGLFSGSWDTSLVGATGTYRTLTEHIQ